MPGTMPDPAKSQRLIGAAIAIALTASAILYGVLRQPAADFIDPADSNLLAQGKSVYANHCAACHGASLQGQPNWRERLSNGRLPAPPHDQTGHTWHHPDAMLIDMVTHGMIPGKTAPPGYESDMPAYRDILTDEEIVAVIAYIKSSWPRKVLRLQKKVTLQQQN